jgi:hypothetical protein
VPCPLRAKPVRTARTRIAEAADAIVAAAAIALMIMAATGVLTGSTALGLVPEPVGEPGPTPDARHEHAHPDLCARRADHLHTRSSAERRQDVYELQTTYGRVSLVEVVSGGMPVTSNPACVPLVRSTSAAPVAAPPPGWSP